MTKLTAHFSLEELTVSQEGARRGLNNTPDGQPLANLRKTANGMELVRAYLTHPIFVSSGYRSPEVNKAVGGSPTSAHVQGFAADFISPGFGTPLKICRTIECSPLHFDQLILEFGQWVHISFDPRNRREVLTAKKVGGKTTYLRGIHA